MLRSGGGDWRRSGTGVKIIELKFKNLPFAAYFCISMKVFKDLEELPRLRNAVITIGSFDGIHKGHLKILQKVKNLARDIKGESTVITFHPHPRLIVYPKDNSLRLLTTIEEKIRLFERQGIDNLVIVPFTVEFSQQSADEYIQKFLVGRFSPRYIVIGYDHRFGLNRRGNIDYLRWHSEEMNYEVVEIAKHEVKAIAVSSTKIRKAIESKAIRQANDLLGHTYTLSGAVVRGQKIGRQIGFPTANLRISDPHKLVPPPGIYAVTVLHGGMEYQGMLYIGNRPTLEAFDNVTIEVNIFEFNQDIYDEEIVISLIDFIREDKKFDSLEALSQQLAEDKLKTQAILTNLPAQETVANFPEVGIVILNYNGRTFLEKFLPSILASTYPNFFVCVADNGSTDDSMEWLGKVQLEEVQILQLDQNYGFADGYNRALKEIDADYYVLLNSDIEVEAGWMDPIIELLEKDRTIGACQPLIRSYRRKDHFEYAGGAGGWIDILGYPFCRGRILDVTEQDNGQYNNVEEIFWATGAALFVRSQLFKEIGGFDPLYFAHSEEIDLCWRLKRAGYKVVVQPKSIVYHVGGGTLNYQTPKKTFLNFRNSLFTLMKNENRQKLLWLLPVRILLDAIAGGLFFYQRKWPHIIAIIQAHWSFFYHFNTVRAQRKKDQTCIDKISIAEEAGQLSGRYKGSIVWQYYALGRKRFTEIVK